LNQWEPLKEHLDEHGWWTTPTLLHEATRLLGMRAENASTDADVYLLRLMNLSVETEQNRIAVMQMMKPENVPDALKDAIQGRQMKADYSRQALAERVEGEMAGLRELEEYLRIEFDEPSQAGAEDRAMVVEGEAGRLLHRYTVAAENAFHRAYQNFLKARAKEETLIVEAPEIPLPNEPKSAVESAPVVLPNEPNSAVERAPSPSKARISDEAPAVASSTDKRQPARSTGAPCEVSGSSGVPLPNEPNFGITSAA
jgi:plasmid stability protein